MTNIKVKREALRQAMIDNLMTASDLSKKIRCHKTWIFKLLSQEDRNCSLEFVKKTLNAFNNKYSKDDLFIIERIKR